MNASDRGKQHRNHDHRRGHGSILKGDRAMRARELVEQPEPSGESQMPEPGQEWETILADLQRRATASHVNNSGQENSPSEPLSSQRMSLSIRRWWRSSWEKSVVRKVSTICQASS